MREEFGTIAYSGGKSSEIEGERPYALASVLYDVLNRVALDAVLGKARAYEVDLAVAQLMHTRPGDLLLLDRNYPSYRITTIKLRCIMLIHKNKVIVHSRSP